MRAVHGAVVQIQRVRAAQFRQQRAVQAWPDTCLGPVPQPAPGRDAGTAHGLGGHVAPGRTGPQYVHDASEGSPVHARAPAGPWSRPVCHIGTLVNVGSMYAMNVNRPRWQSAYLASSAAVHQLTTIVTVAPSRTRRSGNAGSSTTSHPQQWHHLGDRPHGGGRSGAAHASSRGSSKRPAQVRSGPSTADAWPPLCCDRSRGKCLPTANDERPENCECSSGP